MPEKINIKVMNIYELIEGRETSIREIAMRIVERNNRGKPTAMSRRWIAKMCADAVFMRSLKKEASRYDCLYTSLVDIDGWLDTASMFAEAINILEQYTEDMKLDYIQGRNTRRRW